MPAPILLGPPPPPLPRRIVSLVPSLTETLAALGLDAETVGLTRFCVHPAGWMARKAVVGGTKNVRVDRLLGLAPDLMLATREENEREAVEAVAAAGVPVWLGDIATVADAVDAVRDLGRQTGRTGEADALAGQIATAFDGLRRPGPALRAAYLIWRDPWMSVGADTFVHDVMARGGFENVFADRTRYPTVTLGEIAAARPDVVLLSSEPFPFREAYAAEVEAGVPGARALLVDGEAFSWYGSRLLGTPAVLAALHEWIGA